jgi:hypothetical protein
MDKDTNIGRRPGGAERRTRLTRHNAHLSISLKGRGFADRGLIPRGILGSAWRDQRCVELPNTAAAPSCSWLFHCVI